MVFSSPLPMAAAASVPTSCDQVLVDFHHSLVVPRPPELWGRDFVAGTPIATDSRDMPEWSHDGRRLAWIDKSGAGHNVYVGNSLGLERVLVYVVKSTSSWVRWTPDSRYLKVRDSDGWRVVSIDGTLMFGPVYYEPILSPDGARVAFVESEPTGKFGSGGELWVSDLDGTNRVLISGSGTNGDPWIAYGPAWSHDGSQIAWWARYSSKDVEDQAVWASLADGTGRVRLGAAAYDFLDYGVVPVWSPTENVVAWGEGAFATGTFARVWTGGLGQPTISRSLSNWTTFSGWSASGDRMGLTYDGNTVVVDVDTGRLVAALMQDTARGIRGVGHIDWAPDNSFAIRYDKSGTARTAVFDRFGSPQFDLDSSNVRFRPCPAFSDVAPGSFARLDIAMIEALGITKGTSPSTYSPSRLVTRAEMATFLARLWTALGNTCPVGPTPFIDVQESSFAAAPVRCIYGLNVTKGTSATTFSPDAPVTREQMAAFLERMWVSLGGACNGGLTPFTDLAGSFAADSVACIYGLAITGGTSSTTYSPRQLVTREQMASFLARFWRIA